MAWTIEFDPKAFAELRRLESQQQRRILRFLCERVAPLADPRSLGQALRGPLHEFWKYRIGDFRVLCDIRDAVLTILVVRVGHRRDVYRR